MTSARLPTKPSESVRRPDTAPGGPSSQLLLLSVVAVLCVVGLVMVLSSSSVQPLRDRGSPWMFFGRQVMWLAAGAMVMALVARVDYRLWKRLATPLLGLSVVLLVVVLLPGTGISVNGSSRWLGVGKWRMQPSELAKLAILCFSAGMLCRRPREPQSTRIRPVLVATATLAGLVMLQPDMGTTLIIGCVVIAVLHVDGVRLRTMAGLVAAAGAAAFVAGMVEPYRRARMLSFLNPWADAGNSGYQVVQSLVGMGTGGVTGVGLGASRAKWGFLPNAHTDFSFSIIGEELGLLGSLLVIALFVVFVLLGVRAATKAPDRFGTLLAAGITAWIAAQALVNMGAVVGVLPVTGVPLPFVSFGGSSLVILMGAVGILLNITARGADAGRVPARRG